MPCPLCPFRELDDEYMEEIQQHAEKTRGHRFLSRKLVQTLVNIKVLKAKTKAEQEGPQQCRCKDGLCEAAVEHVKDNPLATFR